MLCSFIGSYPNMSQSYSCSPSVQFYQNSNKSIQQNFILQYTPNAVQCIQVRTRTAICAVPYFISYIHLLGL